MPNYTLPIARTHFISLASAIDMTARYRKLREDLLLPEYRGLNILCTSETFNLADMLALVTEPGCFGFRIYYGMKEDKTIHALLIGTDAAGNDLLPVIAAVPLASATDPLILQDGQRCPPLCPVPSPLNP